MAKIDKQSLKKDASSPFALIVIPLIIIVSYFIYEYVLGNPANFEDGDPSGHPLPGNYLGIVYKGGIVVTVLIALFLMVITFSVERGLTIGRAKGKGGLSSFVKKIRAMLADKNVDKAIEACNTQKGSVANVIRSGLIKYKEMEGNQTLDIEKKELVIKKELDETKQLEMPMLEKNLVILSTIASIATLAGLVGTVTGMIKAFAALASAGVPDAVGLANGISEALVNTAFGVGGSFFAIIAYNFFTTKIDSLSYAMDEAGYSIIQSFETDHNK